MKNKGFTLIELLAVIVILAIIALIATPVILGIIEDSRLSANARSAEMIKAGVQNAYTSYLMESEGTYPTSESIILDDKYFTVDGATPDATNKKVTSGDVSCAVSISGSTATITCTGKTSDAVVFPEDAAGADQEIKDGKKKVYTFTAKLAS